MAKPGAIRWLESETGQTIDYQPERVPQERHLSVRISSELAAAVESLAADRNQSISHLVRDLLIEAVQRRDEVAALDHQGLVDRLAADVAEVSRRLAG